MTVIEKTLKLATSFVYKDFKPVNDEGSGEAKIYVGSTSEQDDFNAFFGFDGKQKLRYKFEKNNLLEYLQQVKLEYVYQFFNKYKNINIDTWNNNYKIISSLDNDSLYIDLRSHLDQRRYYIRSDNDLFKNTLRKMSIPKLTNIKFQKLIEKNLMLILLEVDYSYSISDNSIVEDRLQTALGENKIFYGVPGSGKSYYIEQHYSVNENNSMRVVFHPDYTYSDFVGQILPKIVKGENGSEDKLKYEFIPGPFTKILKKANENPEQQFYLIIEELNRGNAPAIFGEIFQLLDRNENGSAVGESKYSITNAEIADIVFKNTETPIKIPANLSILATMNTSDQNVFTMDTAFQRRWIMVHIPNKFKSPQADQKIADSEITWKAFAEAVNDKLTEISGELTSTEDKRLGAYFAREADFKDRSRFAEKVLKYLWDDAFKMERSAIFKASFKTLSSVIEKFEDDKIENPLNEVLDSEIYKDICERMKEASSMQEQAQRIEE